MRFTRREVGVRSLASIVAAVSVAEALAQAAADPAAPTGPDSGAGQAFLEARWVDLEKGEPTASMALLELNARPKESVPFLKERMKPLKIDAERVRALLTELGSKDEAVWKPAFEELEYFDPRLAIGLETLMADVRDAPARQRMVAVMSGRAADSNDGKQVDLRKAGGGFNFFSRPGGSWWAEAEVKLINSTPGRNPKSKWTRAVRAIALLEHLATPEAVTILKRVSLGHEEAQPTVEARSSLKRLGFKGR